MASQAFDITFKATKFFLDREQVRKRLGRANARALSKAGAFVRRRARTQILRRRKTVSQPGSPPSIHSRSQVATLKNILFAYDPRSNTVVVGPVKLNQATRVNGSRSTVPELLEFGGTQRIHEERYRGADTAQWYRRDLRRRVSKDKIYRARSATYQPRPFMRPALQAEIDAGTIPKAWANSVRAA